MAMLGYGESQKEKGNDEKARVGPSLSAERSSLIGCTGAEGGTKHVYIYKCMRL
jgi:hypothetical protein